MEWGDACPETADGRIKFRDTKLLLGNVAPNWVNARLHRTVSLLTTMLHQQQLGIWKENEGHEVIPRIVIAF
jgi:hypothetical protein